MKPAAEFVSQLQFAMSLKDVAARATMLERAIALEPGVSDQNWPFPTISREKVLGEVHKLSLIHI